VIEVQAEIVYSVIAALCAAIGILWSKQGLDEKEHRREMIAIWKVLCKFNCTRPDCDNKDIKNLTFPKSLDQRKKQRRSDVLKAIQWPHSERRFHERRQGT
jgi:hypothetical protein